MNQSLTKFILLIPLRYNDGRPVPEQVIATFQEHLFRLGGGFTVAGFVRGEYRMEDGTRQIDECLQVWIGIPEESYPEFRQLVGKLGAELGQESMYLEQTGATIHFVPPQ
jgi:hypothetical protein